MEKIQPVQLTESVLAALSVFVREHAVQVGDRLPAERVIAQQLGISRPILREALGRWAALGVIETRNGSGSYLRRPVEAGASYVVLSISAERHDLLKLLELRRALEVEASGLAALRRTEAELEHLRACYQRADAVQGQGGSDPDADWAFHAALYEAAGNAYFKDIFMSLQGQFRRIFSNPLHIHDFANRSWPIHFELLEAVERQDVEGARDCTRRILEIVKEDLNG